MKLRCVECGSDIDAGLVCARCASRPNLSTPATSHAKGVTKTEGRWTGRWLSIIGAWILVGLFTLVWANAKSKGQFARILPGIGGTIDGTYVCGEMGWPMTVRLDGRTGSIDLGYLRGTMMSVERHGDTVTMSGGAVADAQGRLLSAEERRTLSSGNEVEIFTLADNGQSLRLDIGDGRTAVFVRQRK